MNLSASTHQPALVRVIPKDMRAFLLPAMTEWSMSIPCRYESRPTHCFELMHLWGAHNWIDILLGFGWLQGYLAAVAYHLVLHAALGVVEYPTIGDSLAVLA
jgi:hypothetical protein